MCGRFTLRTPGRKLATHFELPSAPMLGARYNIAPTQNVAAVRVDKDDCRELSMLHWGLIPYWTKDLKAARKPINARCETAAEKPMFKRAFRNSRCLVVADGFYEWQGKKGDKQPFYIDCHGSPFAFAGLSERWGRGDERIESCTILTTEPNELLAPLHNRMPVIVRPDDYALWLDSGVQEPKRLAQEFEPYPANEMRAYPVSQAVNRPTNESPECVEPIET